MNYKYRYTFEVKAFLKPKIKKKMFFTQFACGFYCIIFLFFRFLNINKKLKEKNVRW